MDRWGLCFISLGLILVCFAPLVDAQYIVIGNGAFLMGIGILMLYISKKRNKAKK